MSGAGSLRLAKIQKCSILTSLSKEVGVATSILQYVDGTLMIEIPSSVLEELGVSVNTRLNVSVEGGRIVVVPQKQSRRQLKDRTADSDVDPPQTE